MCVKSPKNLTSEQLAAVRDEFAVLEQAIKDHDYDRVAALMDIPSYIAMVQLREYVYNVELAAPAASISSATRAASSPSAPRGTGTRATTSAGRT